MATDYKALGKRISNARKQAGITQEALGEQLMVAFRMACRINSDWLIS